MPHIPLHVDPAHPAFAGHFPGQPIVPGVVLLDLTQIAIEAENGLTLAGLAACKFLSPARPGDALALSYERGASGVKFEIRCGERLIASGRFLLQSAEPA